MRETRLICRKRKTDNKKEGEKRQRGGVEKREREKRDRDSERDKTEI